MRASEPSQRSSRGWGGRSGPENFSQVPTGPRERRWPGKESDQRGAPGRNQRFREQTPRGLNRWERREEEKTGSAEPGSRSRGRGEGEGAGPEARRPPGQSAAGSGARLPGFSRVFRSGRQICWSRWGRTGWGSRSKGIDPRRSPSHSASRHSAPPRRAAVARAGSVGSGRGVPFPLLGPGALDASVFVPKDPGNLISRPLAPTRPSRCKIRPSSC